MESKLKDKKYKKDKQNEFVRFLGQCGKGIKNYYDIIINDKFKQGKDYYVPMFVSEALCFVFLILYKR